ncbi:unnamed protein product, partial [Didymodactylos carnosus]
SIEIFIYFCDCTHYPTELNNVKLKPILPSKLPVQHAVILKYIDNHLSYDEVKMDIEEKWKSVYSIKEMLGTQNYRSRHIRVDLLSKNEYETILNCGKISISGQLYDVNEFLPSPNLLICSKCNSPGHMRKNCGCTIEVCRRCGKEKTDGFDHKVCDIKCHHCGGDHESTNFKCPYIDGFRQELIKKLKNNPRFLPPHVQLFLPQRYRDQEGKRTLGNGQSFSSKMKQQDHFFENKNKVNAWPSLYSNTPPHQIN